MENKRRIFLINIILIIILIMSVIIGLAVKIIFKTELDMEIVEKNGSYNHATSATVTNTWNISADGDNSVTATLTDDGTLTISGTGKMKDWSFYTDVEWADVYKNIRYVIIKNGVTNIGDNAFKFCTNLSNIKIANTVTVIGSSAFEYCENLTNIEIPNSILTIELAAFRATGLTSVQIPSSVTKIGAGTFSNCSNLTAIEVDGNNSNYWDDNGVLYTKDKKTIIKYPVQRVETNYSILNGTINIESNAFNECKNLTNIVIPNSVTNIEANAFYGTQITNSVNTTSDTTELPELLKRAQDANDILYSADGFQVTNGTIEGTNITINDGKTYVKIEVLEGKLYGLIYIINWPLDVSEKGDRSVIATLSSDWTVTISGVGNMKSNNSSNSIFGTEIEDKIKKAIIENGVTSIGDSTFISCSNLESVEISNTVTRIGSNAFFACSNLTSVEIPRNVTSLESASFGACFKLTSINVDENNANYRAVDGIVYTKDKTRVIQYPAGKEASTYEILNTVTTIENGAFSNCKNLISMEIPDSVTEIGNAFLGCNNLTSMIIPSSVTKMGVSVFSESDSLVITCKSGTEAETHAKIYSINYLVDDNAPTAIINGISASPVKQTSMQVQIIDEISGLNEESLKYVWTTASEGIAKEQIKTKFTNGDTFELKDVTGTYYLYIYAKDKVGNETIEKVGPIYLDNTAPTASVSYSTTAPTKGNVTVTISANEKIQGVTGWALSTEGKELTKTYTSNGTEDVVIKDLAGNEIETPLKITVENIDKEKPTVGVSYSTTAPTKGNVTVTITSDEQIQGVTGWTLSTEGKVLTKTYTSNGTENVIIKDLAGNEIETPLKITVNNIDKEKPTANVSYSTTNPTKGNVTVTITSDEVIQGITGWTLSTEGKELTKTYTSNGTENVIIKDLAGNEIERPLEIRVNNIDKEKPTAGVSYSETNPTNKDVTVTIKANEKIQGVTGWELSTDGKELSKTYSSNTVTTGENITIKDIAGNDVVVNVKILNIDKTAPTLTITAQTNSNTVNITAESTDEQSGIDTKSYKYYIKEENGEYGESVSDGSSHIFKNLQGDIKYIIKVEVSDKAGNKETKEISVTIGNTMTSKEYKVDEEKAVIKGIIPKTTIGEVMKNLAESETNYQILDLNGKPANKESQIGTGYKVKMAGGKEYTIIVWGDFTGDGKINVSELATASRTAVNKQNLSETQKMILDVSMDGKINIQDLAAISRLAVQ